VSPRWCFRVQARGQGVRFDASTFPTAPPVGGGGIRFPEVNPPKGIAPPAFPAPPEFSEPPEFREPPEFNKPPAPPVSGGGIRLPDVKPPEVAPAWPPVAPPSGEVVPDVLPPHAYDTVAKPSDVIRIFRPNRTRGFGCFTAIPPVPVPLCVDPVCSSTAGR
jgi:hypothetical protein